MGLVVATGIFMSIVDWFLGTKSVEVWQFGAALVLGSVILWPLTLLARTLMTSIHLEIDASERRILINTYLALHRKGQITEEERKHVFETIFRPSTTGIVKGGGRPPHLALEIFNRLRRDQAG